MTMSEPLMASAAEAPSRTPSSSPALRNRAPAGCGNRMSQAAMVVTPAPRRPEAKAWPASPKPMKQRRGVLRDMDWALLDSDQDSRDGCRAPEKELPRSLARDLRRSVAAGKVGASSSDPQVAASLCSAVVMPDRLRATMVARA